MGFTQGSLWGSLKGGCGVHPRGLRGSLLGAPGPARQSVTPCPPHPRVPPPRLERNRGSLTGVTPPSHSPRGFGTPGVVTERWPWVRKCPQGRYRGARGSGRSWEPLLFGIFVGSHFFWAAWAEPRLRWELDTALSSWHGAGLGCAELGQLRWRGNRSAPPASSGVTRAGGACARGSALALGTGAWRGWHCEPCNVRT